MLGHEDLGYCPFAKSEKFLSDIENGDVYILRKKMQEKRPRQRIWELNLQENRIRVRSFVWGGFLGV